MRRGFPNTPWAWPTSETPTKKVLWLDQVRLRRQRQLISLTFSIVTGWAVWRSRSLNDEGLKFCLECCERRRKHLRFAACAMARWAEGPFTTKRPRGPSRQRLAYFCLVIFIVTTTFTLLASTFKSHPLSYAYTRGRHILSSWFQPKESGYFCSTDEVESVQGLDKCSSMPADLVLVSRQNIY